MDDPSYKDPFSQYFQGLFLGGYNEKYINGEIPKLQVIRDILTSIYKMPVVCNIVSELSVRTRMDRERLTVMFDEFMPSAKKDLQKIKDLEEKIEDLTKRIKLLEKYQA